MVENRHNSKVHLEVTNPRAQQLVEVGLDVTISLNRRKIMIISSETPVSQVGVEFIRISVLKNVTYFLNPFKSENQQSDTHSKFLHYNFDQIYGLRSSGIHQTRDREVHFHS